MGDYKFRITTELAPIRISSGKLFLPNDVGSRIENMNPTEEGTLRSVRGPLPFLPDYSASGDAPASGSTPDITVPQYGNMHGIFHATLGNGEREILLVQTGAEIWQFTGWDKSWYLLVGNLDSATTPQITLDIKEDTRPQFPTQFESTSNGVVIVPQNGRALFYDGWTILPLGYSEQPSTPQSRGPQSRYTESGSGGAPTDYDFRGTGPNGSGYSIDALYDTGNAMTCVFNKCRIGDARHPATFRGEEIKGGGGAVGEVEASSIRYGWLDPGVWRGAVQWIDYFGNLSPLSERSEEIRFEYQPAIYKVKGDTTNYVFSPEFARKQVAWAKIPVGREGTIGRILYRTRNMISSGTTDLYELPADASGNPTAFATLPDNTTVFYPDNIPDSWLGTKPVEPVPVPEFKLCRVAFGRLWIANTADEPGLVRPSEPGKWGTFPKNKEFFPDPRGGEVSGMWATDQGLLLFTSRSTFLVNPSDDGQDFRSGTLSSSVGCVAPNSIKTQKSGLTIWLGEDAFYGYDGQKIEKISDGLDADIKRMTDSRRKQAVAAVDTRTGEYRCWMSLDGSRTNNICFIFDGLGWRRRSDVQAFASCVTDDHRSYMITAGVHNNKNGVWLLDHEVQTYQPSETLKRLSTIETAWMTAATSREKKTGYVIYLWLRETENNTVTINVMRDWRNKVVETTTAKRYSGDDLPPFWGSATLGSSTTTWAKRRPYWTRAAVYVPSAEVFKFRIEGTGSWEFVGLQIDEAPRYAGGARIPP